MDTPNLLCPKCKSAYLPAQAPDEAEFLPCPECNSSLRTLVFPAHYRPPEASSAGEKLAEEGEAACFYHEQKKAVTPCDGCGRYLCALCDIEFSGQHLCPACMESGQKKGKIRKLENRGVAYDQMAIYLAYLGLAVWPFTLFTAPAAIYVSLRHWKTPFTLVPRRVRLRFALAIFGASIQVFLWCWGFYLLFSWLIGS